MGQYWKCCSLTKKEFISSHRLDCGLKLWEQLANHPGTGAALIILCAAFPERRGGGDFDLDTNWHGPERTMPKHSSSPGPMPESYPEIAKRTIGRWAGDRIALVGDYAEREDLPPEDNADLIYSLCGSKHNIADQAKHWQESSWTEDPEEKAHYAEKAKRLLEMGAFTDISDDVCAVIEHELNGVFVGDEWREFVKKVDYEDPSELPDYIQAGVKAHKEQVKAA